MTDEQLQSVLEKTFVAAIEFHAEIESTSDRALELSRQPVLELPTLVLAARQSAGRGRGANVWWSADGALTFSLILDAQAVPLGRPPALSLVAGVAVCDAIQSLVPDAHIGLKWPNDVWLGKRKVCGILIEAATQPEPRVVIGVGINVNNLVASAPVELRQTSTSILDEHHRELDLADTLVCVLRQLERQLSISADDASAFQQRWSELCVLTGQQVALTHLAETTRGICLGIDQAGALVLETARGRQACRAGVITEIAGSA